MNPTKGKGKRNIYCPDDTKCVDRAAKGNWPCFHCEACIPEFAEVPEKPMCRECGIVSVKILRDGRPRLCPDCSENHRAEGRRKRAVFEEAEWQKQSEVVTTISFPVPKEKAEKIIEALIKSGKKRYRPWWYQATAYIMEGLEWDGLGVE